MDANKRNALRRLRLLQRLSYARGEWITAALLLHLLAEDPDLSPDISVVLRSLIWLEDQRLAEVRTVDLPEDAVVFARITPEGAAWLANGDGLQGIVHPTECLEVCRAP